MHIDIFFSWSCFIGLWCDAMHLASDGVSHESYVTGASCSWKANQTTHLFPVARQLRGNIDCFVVSSVWVIRRRARVDSEDTGWIAVPGVDAPIAFLPTESVVLAHGLKLPQRISSSGSRRLAPQFISLLSSSAHVIVLPTASRLRLETVGDCASEGAVVRSIRALSITALTVQ